MMQVLDLPVFLKRLQDALSGDLPGETAQLYMASQVRKRELTFENQRNTATKSSVLILLYPHQKVLHTTFILRQVYGGVHSGQISFPGGRYEKEDPTLEYTALREAQEEVNIDPASVQVLGTLSELYIPPSNFIVLPVVGYTDTVPDFIPDQTEVAEIIQADLSFLFDEEKRKNTTIQVRGYEIEAPYYDVKGHIVWGATAMILSELKTIIESLT